MDEMLELGASYYVGWDVGAWHCEGNRTSRDALVILAPNLSIVGMPWRGNLRKAINESKTMDDFICTLFNLCNSVEAEPHGRVFIAIDAALGFPDAFVRLVAQSGLVKEPIQDFKSNPYLHRQSEIRLFQHGLKPLSPVQDMIGSQTVKAMHVVAKFAPLNESCGAWRNGDRLTIVESYPAPCEKSRRIEYLQAKVGLPENKHVDIKDALTMALIAFMFDNEINELAPPGDGVPRSEGWIWLPGDVFKESSA